MVYVFAVQPNRFLDVDSRSGALYCQMCDDFIWDPTFEDLRVKKISTGSFLSKLS